MGGTSLTVPKEDRDVGHRQREREGQGQTSEAAETGAGGPAGAAPPATGGPGVAPWWEAVPGRFDAELEALRQAGIPFQLRQAEKDAGVIVLDLAVTIKGAETPLVARYPDTFPYLRPEVYAPTLELSRHHNPFQKNLCLLGRRSDLWTPQMDLAELVTNQLTKVIDATDAESPAAATEIEEHQGEPISAFYPFEESSACVLDGSWNIPSGLDRGTAKIAFSVGSNGLRATVLELRDPWRTALAQLPWQADLRNLHVGDFRWVKLPRAIRAGTPAAFERELRQLMPHLGKRQSTHGLDLILVLYPEELEWRSEGLGWLLVAREKQPSKGRVVADKVHLVRAARAGAADFAARVPEVAAMRNVAVGIFGLGCVGAPIALDLARASAKALLITDDDFVEAGTAVRWPFGISTVGLAKVDAVAQFVNANYPLTSVRGFKHRIGTPPGTSPLRDRDVLNDIFGTADLILDATAEFGVQRLLSDLALDREIPYIGVYATHGGYGGEVMRLVKGRTGCWMCLALHRADGTIPGPVSKPGEWAQPPGCAAPTFSGGSWDLTEMSLAAVRMAVGTIVGGDDDYEWDVGVLSLRAADGRRIAPQWQTFSLAPHPNCTGCKAL